MPQTRLDGEPIPLSVSELTSRIKERLVSAEDLSAVWVKGEISGFYLHSGSGHAYFELKDSRTRVPCVIYRRAFANIGIDLKDGMEVHVHGSVSVYEPRGVYQLVVTVVKPRGIGEIHLMIAALKKKLETEGLFATERKRALPKLPRRVGVVTSEGGDAFRDIIKVSRRRWPGVRILLAHSTVQGIGAATSIAEGVDLLNEVEDVDVIIVGRGGGSEEDLFAFNEEVVARAIFRSRAPVVSAVGHETDNPISDFVADVRAPTPSAAAELVVPSAAEILDGIAGSRDLMEERLMAMIDLKRTRLRSLTESYGLARPVERIHDLRAELEGIKELMTGITKRILVAKRRDLTHSRELLGSLDPKAILGRGYSIVMKADGRIVRESTETAKGDGLRVILSKGELEVLVEKTRSDPKRKGHGKESR